MTDVTEPWVTLPVRAGPGPRPGVTRPGQPRTQLPAAQERREPARAGEQVDGLPHGSFTAYCCYEYQHAAPHRGAHPDRPGPRPAQVDLARARVYRPRAAARPPAHRP